MSSEATMAIGMCFLGFLASSPIDVTDSKPTRLRIAIQAWMTMYIGRVPVNDGLGGVMVVEGPDAGLGILHHAALIGDGIDLADCLSGAGLLLVGR